MFNKCITIMFTIDNTYKYTCFIIIKHGLANIDNTYDQYEP